jgi:hypothetical protein
MITLAAFVSEWSGIGTNPDHNQYGFQCVEIANEWLKELGLAMLPWTNAQDFDDKLKSDTSDYVWIVNTPTNIPKPGDLVIWQGPGLDFGHIAIFLSGDAMSFTSFDQNWPTGSLPHPQKHTYWNVEGWLHPKVLDAPAPVVAPPAPAPVPAVPTVLAGSQGINIRTSPNINAPIVAFYAAGTVLNYVAVVQGDLVGATDAWYKSAQGHFYWSGATNSPRPRISPVDPRIFVRVNRWPLPGSTLGQIAASNGLSIITLLRFPENAAYRLNPNRVSVGNVVRVR